MDAIGGIRVAMLVLLLTGCTASASDGAPSPSGPSSAPVSTEEPPAVPSAVPTAEVSIPESVTVTFRLTLTGPVPADAAFALQSGVVGGEGGAVYLCSYYGGWPVCESGGIYGEAYAFPPGTQVGYRFWRELDVNGASEEIEAGELTVGLAEQVVSVSYDMQP